MLFGWLAGSLLSVWVSRITLLMLRGKSLQEAFFWIVVGVIFMVYALMLTLALTTQKYESMQPDYEPFSGTSELSRIMCSAAATNRGTSG